MENEKKMTPIQRLSVLVIIVIVSYAILGYIPYLIGGAVISNPPSEPVMTKWLIGMIVMLSVIALGIALYYLVRWVVTGKSILVITFVSLILTSCGRYGYVVQCPTGQKYYTKKVKKKNGCITFKTRNGRQYVMGKYKIEKVKR